MADRKTAPKKRDSENDDLLAEAKAAFSLVEEAEADNRKTFVEDLEFAREGKQWPDKIVKQRENEGRPCLTINKLPAFIRQVVNDARQNKPSIKVRPVDSEGDPDTAEIFDGIIRNIEYTSNADVAYDTATENAVSGGWGYIRVGIDYAYDDSFDQDIKIMRVANPLSVYGDPNSTAADSSDWDEAFVVDRLTKEQFEYEHGDKATVDWDDESWKPGDSWRQEKTVLVAEWWKREKVDRPIVLLSNGMIVDKADLQKPELQVLLQAGMVQVKQERVTKTCKVTQRLMTGAEILSTTPWMGKYIPLVPVYGDEFDIEGKRYLRSLIYSAKDPQRMFNYWRSASTELVALAPRVPFIGRKGAFDHDQERWNTANTQSHAYLEYDGAEMPQRQPMDMGVAAGALQEALNAADDMKAATGLYDASMGARSNETSGRAIMARQREGDVSTFHFMDNMARAIRHTGRILLDLIPKVYSSERIVRVIGEDGSQKSVQLGAPTPVKDKKGNPQPEMGPDGQPVVDPMTGQVQMQMRVYDLAAGKYDLIVKSGPSFTSRREEAAMQMTDMMQAMPQAAPILGKHLAKNLDWPGADDIAEELEAMAQGPQIPPEMQKEIEAGKQRLQHLEQENQQLKADQSADMAKIEAQKRLDAAKVQGQREIEMMKITSNEQIKRAEIEAEERVAQFKAQVQARATIAAAANRPAPQSANV